MENVGHTKMAHDMDAGPASMMDSPYMRVKMNGKRFCDEALGMDLMNCYLTSKEDEGHYCQIFDSDYIEQAKRLGLGYEDFESIKKWMPEEDVEHTGVVPGLIATFKADTLEELAAKLKIKDVRHSWHPLNDIMKWRQTDATWNSVWPKKISVRCLNHRSMAFIATFASLFRAPVW